MEDSIPSFSSIDTLNAGFLLHFFAPLYKFEIRADVSLNFLKIAPEKTLWTSQ